jgi:tetratricopeptide (TPR) repeat protein
LKPGRNDPCLCGSGTKFKNCCARDVPGAGARQNELTAADLERLAGLINVGRYAELEAAARELIRRSPLSAGFAWKALSFALSRQGKDALRALENTARLMPDDAEAQGNLGNALRALGRFEEAAASHRRALALKPDYAEAHNNLGSTLRDLGQLEEAAESFRRALSIRPGFAVAHNNLGIVRRQQSRPAEAEASCRRALEINPSLVAAILLLSELQADQGRFAEAEQSLQRALSIEPELPEAWAAVAGLRKMTAGDAGWLAEAQRIAANPLPPRQQIDLRYAIGKYFDDIADFEQAFGNYRQANELKKRHAAAYDRGRATRAVDAIIERHDRRGLSEASIGANPSPRPVFIVGMPRSGTTLAEQILASHPSVFGAGELPFWGNESAKDPLRSGAHVASPIGKLADEFLRLLATYSGGALRVLDKMPENFLCLGLIHAALPNARIIHMRRNPLDTCLSNYFQNFLTAHAYASDLEDLAHYYREYLRLMTHWQHTLPAEAMLDVAYEDLIEDQETWSRKMVEFVGLPWDPVCLDFHRTERTVSTFSKWQARQPISRSSVGRWRNYERFLGPLLSLPH